MLPQKQFAVRLQVATGRFGSSRACQQSKYRPAEMQSIAAGHAAPWRMSAHGQKPTAEKTDSNMKEESLSLQFVDHFYELIHTTLQGRHVISKVVTESELARMSYIQLIITVDQHGKDGRIK